MAPDYRRRRCNAQPTHLKYCDDGKMGFGFRTDYVHAGVMKARKVQRSVYEDLFLRILTFDGSRHLSELIPFKLVTRKKK
jgi:hypothetical protein